ncbi:MAG: acyl-ACP--UDP-N-acetylglucosamine O-acyltransferase [Myxococcota bacterium]|nr:acyl-ACP--UDP-N-acetylglucosamine O-acyltransferase [Myxococcota bacterium]
MPEIHPTAAVDPRAKLAGDVRIGAFAVVGPEVELAAGVEIRPHAYVTGRTSVGERTRIFPFAAIGEEPQDKSFSGESTQLVIGRDNVIREHATLHVGTPKGGGCTRVGDDNLIMNGVHLGHDSQVGSHCIIASHCAVAGHAVLEDFAVVGGLSGIHQFARVGESAMVAALSGVTKDAPPFSLVAGERATTRGVNVVGLRRRGFPAESRRQIKRAFHVLFGSKLRLPEALERIREEGLDAPEVGRLLRFVESSERGVSR